MKVEQLVTQKTKRQFKLISNFEFRLIKSLKYYLWYGNVNERELPAGRIFNYHFGPTPLVTFRSSGGQNDSAFSGLNIYEILVVSKE